MKLYEFEAKDILIKYGIDIPRAFLISKDDSAERLKEAVLRHFGHSNVLLKAQLLTGKRMKAGAIIQANEQNIPKAGQQLFNSAFYGEQAQKILVEEKIDFHQEFYISFCFDTEIRKPVLMLSKHGGIDVEQASIQKFSINALTGLTEYEATSAIKNAGFPDELKLPLIEFLLRLYKCFSEEDAKLVEINPFVISNETIIALDAMIELDDDAFFRHKERTYTDRLSGLGRALTERELIVKDANNLDHRGTVKYIEMQGDIGFMAAGGGGSLTCMDILENLGANLGAKPANYCEFSGNPSEEKIYRLAKAIISKHGLKALWIVGAIANFTRVDETMKGIVRALEEIKPQYSIVVRRSGPYEQEGMELLRNSGKEHGLDITIFGSETTMEESAKFLLKRLKEKKLIAR